MMGAFSRYTALELAGSRRAPVASILAISWPSVKYGSTGLIRGEPSGRSVPGGATRAWFSSACPVRVMCGAAWSRSSHDAISDLPW